MNEKRLAKQIFNHANKINGCNNRIQGIRKKDERNKTSQNKTYKRKFQKRIEENFSGSQEKEKTQISHA